jgi:hypothetical protein
MSQKNFCGAKNRSGKPCKRAPMPNGRCKLHGGKSPGGVASKTFKHGRYSKYIPDNLQEILQEIRNDRHLLGMREDIALLHARLCRLLETGESADLWQDAKTAFDEFRTVFNAGEQKAVQTSMTKLDKIFQRSLNDVGTWQEIYEVLDQIQKLRTAEHRRMVDLKVMVPLNEVQTLLTRLTLAVKRHVTDVETLRRISAEICSITGKDETDGSWDNPHTD